MPIASTVARRLVVILALITASAIQPLAQERTKQFTVDDIYASRKFSTGGFRSIRWMEGGKASSYLVTDSAAASTDIWRYDIASGDTSILVRGASLKISDNL